MNKRALIVGPNIGVSMGKGGGVKVAAKMGEVLAENGYGVSFCALRGYSPDLLDAVHGTDLMQYRNRVRTHYLLDAQRESNDADGFAGSLPIHIGVLPFSLYLRYVLRKFSPHLLIFHDDIPLFGRRELNDCFLILYIHFSYATRMKLGVGDIAENVAPSRQCIEKLLSPIVRRLIFYNSNPANMIIANSSVTARFLEQTWSHCDVEVLHPPVNTNDYEASPDKENLVISVGVIQPNKRFEDVIRAIGTVSFDCKLVIVGYYQQGWYYQELQRLIDKAGLRNRVRIIPNADKEQLKDLLSKAKIIVHASRFEPFGISVVEGMASGCVPIVHNGPTSGPWSDILDHGEFGLGFGTVKELAENIERVLSDGKVCKYYSLQARKRSRRFDTEIFEQKFALLTRRLGL